MIFRWYRAVAALTGVLLASLLQAEFTFPPRTHKDMEAQLTVTVAKETAERGRGAATLTLTITGPDTLEVEAPRLGDAAAAWQEERLDETRHMQGQRATWKQVIRLNQIKPGSESLADLSVRFRRDPDADWVEERWTDILRHVRVPPLQLPAEEGPSWLRRWGFVLILATTSLLVLLAWLGKRRNIRREPPLPPDQWALREIERIDKTLMPPQGEAEKYHTQMSYIVRRYLAERFGLHALQQTTAEFLENVRHIPEPSAEQGMFYPKNAFLLHAIEPHPPLTEDQQALLIELFQRCDLAKFARSCTTPEDCRRTAELAYDLIRRTSKG
jgi:hypothetical protein